MTWVNLVDLAQQALFAALLPIEADPTMPAGLQVLDHVPENTQPPFIKLGLIHTQNEDDTGEQRETLTAEVHCEYRGPGRAALIAMAHAVRVALDGRPIAAAGAWFEPPRFQDAVISAELDADGLTYLALVKVQFFATPSH